LKVKIPRGATVSAQQVKGEIEVRFDLIRFLLAVAFRIHEPSFEHPLLTGIPFVKEAPFVKETPFEKEAKNISDQTMQSSIG
jgi:hypothetical protein